eukprot:1365153-Amorphochlora_amoeboformis.AAC.3
MKCHTQIPGLDASISTSLESSEDPNLTVSASFDDTLQSELALCLSQMPMEYDDLKVYPLKLRPNYRADCFYY